MVVKRYKEETIEKLNEILRIMIGVVM